MCSIADDPTMHDLPECVADGSHSDDLSHAAELRDGIGRHAEQRKHRYAVTFADGFHTTVEVRPDRLHRRLWDAFPKRMGKDAVTIVDETVAREWLGR